MQLTNQVKQCALLSELAYLKLEDKYWTTPDEYGKVPSYSNYEDLKTFLEKNPKSITDINDSSDSAMLALLSNYTIVDFKNIPEKRGQATLISKNLSLGGSADLLAMTWLVPHIVKDF